MDAILHYSYGDITQNQPPDYYAASEVDNVFITDHTAKISRINSPLGGYCGHEYLGVRREAFSGSPYPLAPEPQPSGSSESCTNTSHWPGPGFEHRPELLPLHAPIPLPGCAPILRTHSYQLGEAKMTEFAGHPSTYFAASQNRSSTQSQACLPVPQNDYDHPSPSQSAIPSQPTFLTPSELLIELSNQDSQHPRVVRGRVYPLERSPRSIYPSHSTTEMIPILDPSFFPPPLNDSGTESITSHEKKRHYLECLEHYVAFLHEHFRRNGLEPVPLERISNYRCLNSRSIRSLLIHMEKLTKQMKEQIFKEEQKFLRLRDTLHRQEASLQATQSVQHERSL